MSFTDSVAAITKAYRANPAVLARVLEALLESEFEKREMRSMGELAAGACRKLHKEPSDHIACGGCFEAALERINGPGEYE